MTANGPVLHWYNYVMKHLFKLKLANCANFNWFLKQAANETAIYVVSLNKDYNYISMH